MIIKTYEIRIKKDSGFTLLELLAVLVILAALATIAIPIFTNKSDEAKATAHSQNLKILQQQGQQYIWQANSVAYGDITTAMVDTGYIKELPTNPLTGAKDYTVIAKVDGTVIVSTGGFNGVCNAPRLVQGMTPIYWNGSSWVATTVDNPGEIWYKYNGDIDATKEADGVTPRASTSDGIGRFINDRWANVKLAEGSMFVWIPRYTYKITGSGASRKIEIKYSNGTVDNTEDSFLPHPAFRFGGTELTGIWVAKFEASAMNGQQGTNGDKVQVKPGVASWRYITIGNSFTVCKDMIKDTTYGWTANSASIDTHMMKNSEWGAVAYLTEAIRDGEQIWINNKYEGIEPPDWGNNMVLRTGYCGNSQNASRSTLGTPSYYYNEGLNGSYADGGARASTTGNIYGVYDLSGGAWERVASYINNGNGNLLGQGASLVNAESKYKDVLTAGSGTFDDGSTVSDAVTTDANNKMRQNNYNITAGQTLGLALHEVFTNGFGTSNFRNYNDYQYFPYNSSPFFVRGATFDYTSNAGVFACDGTVGSTHSSISFRPCVVALP